MGRQIPIALALGLALASAILPSQVWLWLFRGPGPDDQALLQGAVWLRCSLAILAAWLFQEGCRGAFAPSPHGAKRQSLGWPIAAILVAGAVARCIALDLSLWGDEVETLVRYVRLPTGELLSTYLTQNQQFLYSLLAKATTVASGESAWALRLPAVALGVASLYAVASLARAAGARAEGLWAAALLAVSYHHVWFSQNARGYTGLLAAALVSTELFVRALQERRPSLWRWYGLACALGAWLHMNMIFVVVGQFVAWAALRARRSGEPRAQPLSGFFLAAILTLALHAIAAPQILGPALADRSKVSEWKSPLWTLSQMAPMEFSWGLAAAALGLALMAWGAWSWLHITPEVVIAFVAALAAGLAATIALGHPIWPRFFFFEIGFAALALVRGLVLAASAFGDSPKRVAATLTTLLLVSAASLPAAYKPKQDYLGARDFVLAISQPAEQPAAAGVAGFVYANYYAPQWARIETSADLEALESRCAGVWFLYSLPLHFHSYHPDVYRHVHDRYKLERVFPGTLGDGDVYVYHWRAAGGQP